MKIQMMLVYYADGLDDSFELVCVEVSFCVLYILHKAQKSHVFRMHTYVAVVLATAA